MSIELFKTDDDYELSFKQYVEKVLTKFNMNDCKKKATPCDAGLDKKIDETALLDDVKEYQELVGSFIYQQIVCLAKVALVHKNTYKSIVGNLYILRLHSDSFLKT